MPNILDAFPYPWAKKEAQQLHVTLYKINPDKANSTLVADSSGFDVAQIDLSGSIAQVWANILTYGATQGLNRKLVQDIHDRLNPTSPYRVYLNELLSNKSPELDAEPTGVDGAPKFITGSDDITENEALLYRDDLTLQIGKIPHLITTLQKLITYGPSVCKLVVDIHGTVQNGTGFRISDNMILTNWHVLHRETDGTRATTVTAEFLYEDNGAGGVVTPVQIPCDVNSIQTDKQDDWAVITTLQPMDAAWPIIKLSEAVAPQLSSSAYIIQHPRGDRKRVGFIRNQVSDFDKRVVHYLTDTQGGSSGSPVFDESGKLFGLHHAGGRPQEVLGKPPMSKNEGICISKVVEGLKKNNIAFP